MNWLYCALIALFFTVCSCVWHMSTSLVLNTELIVQDSEDSDVRSQLDGFTSGQFEHTTLHLEHLDGFSVLLRHIFKLFINPSPPKK